MLLPIIRSTSFDVSGVQHTNYSVQYKGFAFKASTFRFGDSIKPTADGKSLEIPDNIGYIRTTFNKVTPNGIVPATGYEFTQVLDLPLM